MKLPPSFTTISGAPVFLARDPNDTLLLLKFLNSIQDINERPSGTLLLDFGVGQARHNDVTFIRMIEVRHGKEHKVEATFGRINRSEIENTIIVGESFGIDVTVIKAYTITNIPARKPKCSIWVKPAPKRPKEPLEPESKGFRVRDMRRFKPEPSTMTMDQELALMMGES